MPRSAAYDWPVSQRLLPCLRTMDDNGEMLAMAIVALRKARAHAKTLEAEARALQSEVSSALAFLPSGAAPAAQPQPSGAAAAAAPQPMPPTGPVQAPSAPTGPASAPAYVQPKTDAQAAQALQQEPLPPPPKLPAGAPGRSDQMGFATPIGSMGSAPPPDPVPAAQPAPAPQAGLGSDLCAGRGLMGSR